MPGGVHGNGRQSPLQPSCKQGCGTVTREHKLALIIGFTLILIVGVLMSDHLSGQRELKLASVAVDDERATLGLGDAISPLVKWAEQSARDISPAVSTTPTITEPEVSAPSPQPTIVAQQEPVIIPQSLGTETPSSNLTNAIRQAGGTLQSGPDGSAILTLGNGIASGSDAAPPASEKPRVDPKDVKTYRIQDKDNLYSIAKSNYGDPGLWKALAEYNEGRVGKDGTVRVGATIKLPPRHVLTGEAPEAKPQAAKATESRSASEPARREAMRTHTVVKGDSLAKIAQTYLGSKDRVNEIVAANRDKISDPNQIRIDMVLQIPPK